MEHTMKHTKVSESITINRYDNGWMVEASGTDAKGDWGTSKTICNTEEELIAVVKQWNSLDLTD